MSKAKRLVVAILATATFAVGVAPAFADPPGPGSKPQCAGGPSNGNPHCPQNK